MIIKSALEVQKALEFIENNDIIAYDIESTGLNVRKEKIIGFGLSNAKESIYVAHLKWNGDKLVELISFDDCCKIVTALVGKKLLMFNGSFDSRFTLHYFGVDLIMSLYCEVMLLKHTVDENQPFRLKDIAKKLFGADAAAEQLEMKASIKANGGSEKEYFKADLDIMGKYCEQDCMLTYKIYEHYLPILNRENLNKFFFVDEVMPFYKEVGILMELYGVKLDIEALEIAHKDIKLDIERIESSIQADIKIHLDKFEEWYLWKNFSPNKFPALFKQALCSYANLDLPRTGTGKYSLSKKNVEALPESNYRSFLVDGNALDKDVIKEVQLIMFKDTGEQYMFNLSSKDHLKKLFFDKLGENPVTKTDKGAPQINDLFLEKMVTEYSWVKDLRIFNKLNKLNSTYIEGILEKQEDGVFYPSWFMHRTISGRLSGNLQQLPRPKEVGELDDIVLKYNNLVRKFFISGKDHKFLDADYESLEPHIFAHVSNDEGLKDIFRNGHDFYATVAIATEGLKDVSADKKADDYLGAIFPQIRQKAKEYCLGVPYGLEGYALSFKLNIKQREAELLIISYLNSYPMLKKWMDDSKEQCVINGFVKSEAGRIRHMPLASKLWSAYGEDLLDSLKLWKKYHEAPSKYTNMKYLRKQLSNFINNSRNFQIQSLAASITNRACIAINRELKRKGIDGYVCAQVHDQIIVSIANKDAKRFMKSMRYIMENVYKISLKLKAPVEIGENMYETH